jgi:hypothetical protein
MNKLAILSALAGAAMLSGVAMAQQAPTGDYVCVITFPTPELAAQGNDADAISAVYVTRDEADDLVAASDGSVAYWDYTDQGYPTNAEEQEFCLTNFNSDDGDDDGDNSNSAKSFAPGQLKKDGETGADYAPGQIKEDGETGKDNAPGQLKKADPSAAQ